jgi:hypothetical protein
MPDGFISLGDWVREMRAHAPLPPPDAPEASDPELAVPEQTAEIASFAEEIALLRLRVVESFERSRERLLRRFAEEVLVREQQLLPADIEAIARKALIAFAEESPVALAVAPAEAACLRADIPVRADAALQPGDIIVDIADGRFESPLRLRVARIIQETLREEEPL